MSIPGSTRCTVVPTHSGCPSAKRPVAAVDASVAKGDACVDVDDRAGDRLQVPVWRRCAFRAPRRRQGAMPSGARSSRRRSRTARGMSGGRWAVSTDAERKMSTCRRAPRRREHGQQQDDEQDLARYGEPPDAAAPGDESSRGVTGDPRRSRRGRALAKRGNWPRRRCCSPDRRGAPPSPPSGPGRSGPGSDPWVPSVRSPGTIPRWPAVLRPAASARTSGNIRRTRVLIRLRVGHVALSWFDMVSLELSARDLLQERDQLQERHLRSIREVHGLRVDHPPANCIGEDGDHGPDIGEIARLCAVSVDCERPPCECGGNEGGNHGRVGMGGRLQGSEDIEEAEDQDRKPERMGVGQARTPRSPACWPRRGSRASSPCPPASAMSDWRRRPKRTRPRPPGATP